MAASEKQIRRVRRMCAENNTSTDYSDEDIAEIIEEYPLLDDDGYEPENLNWTPTYDLNAAAAAIWDEKAAALVANGAVYESDSAHLQAMRQARYYRSKRAVKTISMTPTYPVDPTYLIEDIHE
jgi:hypothetical protein